MSSLNKILEDYGKLYSVIYEQDPAAVPPAPVPAAAPPMDPAAAAPPAPAAPAPADAEAEEAPLSDVDKVQDMQDALGIDPSKLLPADKSVFKDEVTPKNAIVKLKKMRQIIQDNEPPTHLR